MAKKLDETFTQTLITWYRNNRRDLPWRRDRQPYHVWVSEIMLQQTRVEAVRDYYLRFMETLPTVEALAAADEETLLKLWQGLGYYNRVRNLQRAAQVVVQNPQGAFPDTLEEILALPGIGAYTAGAIASICFNLRMPAVDGNVLRVMARLRNDPRDIKAAATKGEVAAFLTALYPTDGTDGACGDFTQALIELGALVCIPNGAPLCQVCPVAAFCQAREANTALSLPVKSVKRPRRREERTVLILTCGDKVAVRKRPAGSLLANLYEFPGVGQPLTAAAAVSQAEAWGCRPVDLTRSAKYKHIFTHVEWDMTGYYITCAAEGTGMEAAADDLAGNNPAADDPAGDDPAGDAPAGQIPFRWVSWKEMEEEIPLPSAFRYFWR